MVEEMVQTGDITQDDKLWSLLGWIFWPIALICLLIEDKKNRPFIKYNAVQSLVLGGVAWLTSVIGIGLCLGPLAFIYGIVLGIQANSGKWVTIPVITDFCKNQGWI